MLGKIILSRDGVRQTFLNTSAMSGYRRRQDTQGKASSRIISPRLEFQMNSTPQRIMFFTTDLISWVFGYIQFISRYCSFLQVWDFLRCSDPELILKLIISLDIL